MTVQAIKAGFTHLDGAECKFIKPPRPARPIPNDSLLSRKGGPALNVPETPTPASPAYRNEWELGEAIRRSGAPRSTLFVTTKLRSARKTDPSAALRRSLDRLGLDYVDLYLVHSPFRAEWPEQLRRLWRGMEDAREAGLARSVGVSNFTREHLEIILEGARSKPAVNQSAFAPTSTLPLCFLSFPLLCSFARHSPNIT